MNFSSSPGTVPKPLITIQPVTIPVAIFGGGEYRIPAEGNAIYVTEAPQDFLLRTRHFGWTTVRKGFALTGLDPFTEIHVKNPTGADFEIEIAVAKDGAEFHDRRLIINDGTTVPIRAPFAGDCFRLPVPNQSKAAIFAEDTNLYGFWATVDQRSAYSGYSLFVGNFSDCSPTAGTVTLTNMQGVRILGERSNPVNKGEFFLGRGPWDVYNMHAPESDDVELIVQPLYITDPDA